MAAPFNPESRIPDRLPSTGDCRFSLSRLRVPSEAWRRLHLGSEHRAPSGKAEMEHKRRKPIAVCSRGHVAYLYDGIAATCGRRISRTERCGGDILSGLNEKDWEQCPSCSGVGHKAKKRCERCEGAGWLFVRPHH
jgi:hypothetical protein